MPATRVESPAIYGAAPPPWPNEVITIVALALCCAAFWMSAKSVVRSRNPFRNPQVFYWILAIAFSAYWAQYGPSR